MDCIESVVSMIQWLSLESMSIDTNLKFKHRQQHALNSLQNTFYAMQIVSFRAICRQNSIQQIIILLTRIHLMTNKINPTESNIVLSRG